MDKSNKYKNAVEAAGKAAAAAEVEEEWGTRATAAVANSRYLRAMNEAYAMGESCAASPTATRAAVFDAMRRILAGGAA